MDDFDLGLSSGSFFKDEFYESFQAPKFYDFINPRDSGNADEWFFRASVLASSPGIKELLTSAAKSVEQEPDPSSLPALKKCQDNKVGRESSSAMYCSENEDPNHGSPERPAKYLKQDGGKAGKKLKQKPEELSPSSHCRTRNPRPKLPHAAPATVPQKKVLATRKAALEAQRQPASKSLLESFRQNAAGSQGTSVAVGAKKETSFEGNKPSQLTSKNHSQDFQDSCRRSDDEQPKCRRALGQEQPAWDTAKYVVEQAEMVESAIKLLKLGDEEKNAQVCTEIMGAVCADGKVAVTQKTKQVFSFTATRKETSRKRKSIEMNKRHIVKQDDCSKKAANSIPVCTSPPPATATALPGREKKLRVTCPQPFRLRTEERGALKEIEFNKKMEHYIALKEGLCSFDTTSQSKPKIMIKRRLHRVPKPPKPDTRSPVEVSIEMLARDLAKLKTAEAHPPEAEDTKTLPRKSKPMPSFDRPFKPQRSTKKLTIPIEPKFHVVHGRRTCSRHCHTSDNNNNTDSV